MMVLLTLVSAAAILCCPPTIPIWVFVLIGFHTTVRRELRAQYLRRHGKSPKVGSWDWFLVYL